MLVCVVIFLLGNRDGDDELGQVSGLFLFPLSFSGFSFSFVCVVCLTAHILVESRSIVFPRSSGLGLVVACQVQRQAGRAKAVWNWCLHGGVRQGAAMLDFQESDAALLVLVQFLVGVNRVGAGRAHRVEGASRDHADGPGRVTPFALVARGTFDLAGFQA